MKFLAPAEALASWEAARRPSETAAAALRVCGAVLFQPTLFFQALLTSRTNTRKRLIHAAAFALIWGYIKLLCDGLNILWLKQLVAAGLPLGRLPLQIEALETSFFLNPLILARPLLTLGATFLLVAAGVKLIFGVDKGVVPAALVVCYKSAAEICNIIPFLGGLLASAWSLALLVIGVRELYRAGVGRAVLAGVAMPVLVLFFLALSLGPALKPAILALYPETQPQVMKFNDVTAYGYTAAIVKAAQEYREDLGFYPVNLSALKKYLAAGVADDLRVSDDASGYCFQYVKSDEGHFAVTVQPLERDVTGSLMFYADESGKVRLGGKDGRVLTDVQSLERALAAPGGAAEKTI